MSVKVDDLINYKIYLKIFWKISHDYGSHVKDLLWKYSKWSGCRICMNAHFRRLNSTTFFFSFLRQSTINYSFSYTFALNVAAACHVTVMSYWFSIYICKKNLLSSPVIYWQPRNVEKKSGVGKSIKLFLFFSRILPRVCCEHFH